MATLDLIIIIVLCIGALIGFVKGLIKQVVSIVGLIVGLLVARALFGAVGEKLAVEVGMSATFGQILAFLLIWIVVPLGLSLMASILTKALDKVKLGFINRWLGSGLGLIKYALLVSMFINLVQFIDVNDSLIHAKSKQNSALYYPMQKFAGIFKPALKSVTKSVGKHLINTEDNNVKEDKE